MNRRQGEFYAEAAAIGFRLMAGDTVPPADFGGLCGKALALRPDGEPVAAAVKAGLKSFGDAQAAGADLLDFLARWQVEDVPLHAWQERADCGL